MAIAPTPAAAASAYAALARLGAQSGASAGAGATAASGPSFGSVLKDVVDAVAKTGGTADVQEKALAMGKANMIDVVTAVAESETAIATLVSVRDKVISAYEDILKMPI
jgi:flagellar hook-basal body complex protein FliE